ncbi:RDD family protein [Rhizohabitans arisaemae]|uniref:RDD family protein n=1 Tax=Rhizohabitans arisaemae TaxID=2720610 RepID=UPI0024B17680|nr:RDD family protein [Rhizohabitans arisaemae]
MSGERRWTQTWISGTRAAGVDLGYPGEQLGLPPEGSGSVAGWGRRIGALLIDWFVCVWAIAQGLLRMDAQSAGLWGLVILFTEYVLLTGTLGWTLGMRVVNIRVAGVHGGRPSLPSVVIRAFLLCLAVPALIWDRDHRGLHDRAAGTVVVRV